MSCHLFLQAPKGTTGNPIYGLTMGSYNSGDSYEYRLARVQGLAKGVIAEHVNHVLEPKDPDQKDGDQIWTRGRGNIITEDVDGNQIDRGYQEWELRTFGEGAATARIKM